MPSATVNLPAATETELLKDHGADRQVRVKNTGANPCTLGSPGVTVASGFHVLAGAEETVQVDAGDRLHAISTAGTTVDLEW